MAGFEDYMAKFNERLSSYIPAQNDWTPADEALFRPRDFYRIPLAEAEDLQFKAIKSTFILHYNRNAMYRAFCHEAGVSPADLKQPDDLVKIPLIPDRFFKEHPDGKDFAIWLGNLCTGDLPKIVIRSSNPSFDEVIDAFNQAGMVVSFSSGTSGRSTVIPRDQRTYRTSQYAASKSIVTMVYPGWDFDVYGYLLMPNPMKTNVYAGKVCGIYFDAIKDVRVAINREISARVIRLTMSREKSLRSAIIRFIYKAATIRMVDQIIQWLEVHARANHRIALVGAPFIVSSVIQKLRKQGRSFDFHEQGSVITGGGWKAFEEHRIGVAEFRRQVEETLGIQEKVCLDVYGMVEGNGWMVQCPEGHYLHVPYSYYKPLVLDQDNKPLDYGEWGRYAFLDAAALSYPGFILTSDMVRMLEHCPVCDRPGPVLEPEIRRVVGEDIRGCAEEVRQVISADLGG
jgi:phenylacetate-coenzyme A ligase PaaK-like adenylate-forming protein